MIDPTRRILTLFVIALCYGCATTGNDPNVPPKDRLESFEELAAQNPSLAAWNVDQWNPGTDESSVAERKVRCTARDDEGRCVSATCEADEESNCATWLFWCWWYGYQPTGDAQSATCTRVEAFPCCED